MFLLHLEISPGGALGLWGAIPQWAVNDGGEWAPTPENQDGTG